MESIAKPKDQNQSSTVSFREKLYEKVAFKFPKHWKLIRMLFFGKYDFNDLIAWEKEYIDTSNIAGLQDRVPEIVEHILKFLDAYESVLEVSAGFGNFITKVPKAIQCYATEFSDQAIEYLKNEGIATKKAVLPELPYEDNFVDVVVSISVFEHLKNAKVVRKSFESCHRVCKDVFILALPFECMQPWNTKIHNHDFSKQDILDYSKGLFEMVDWAVFDNGNTKRSVSILKKI